VAGFQKARETYSCVATRRAFLFTLIQPLKRLAKFTRRFATNSAFLYDEFRFFKLCAESKTRYSR
jgi:hypothetical protein